MRVDFIIIFRKTNMKKILLSCIFASASYIAVADVNIKFDDYCKEGDNGFDAMAKIIEIARSKNGEPVLVEFSNKTYDFKKAPEHSWFFPIVGVENLTIDGKGAKLMIDPFNAYCTINNCKNVTLKNFEFVHNRLAFTQGDIVEVTPEYFVFKLDDGYPEFPSHEFVMKNYPGSQWMWGSFMDREARTLKYGYPDHIFAAKIEPADKPRHYKFYPQKLYTHILKNIHPPVAFVMPIHQDPNKSWRNSHGPYTIGIAGSSDILIENITARATRHAGWSGINNEGKITFKNCVVTWRENSSDLISSWRDGSHFKNNKIGPAFIGCKWEGLLDDSINIGANPTMILEDMGDSTYRIRGGSLKKGCPIAILNPKNGQWLEGKEWFVEDISGNVVKLSKPIPDLVLYQNLTDYERTSGRGGINMAATEIFNMDYVGAGYVVRDCKFGKQRRYSMIIRAPNGTIEDNKIYGGTGIHLSNEIGSWYEGPLPRNTKVRGNTFENTWGPCPLVVSVGIFPNIKFGLPYGISIIDNTFKLTMPENKYAISIYNGSDFTIKRNKYFNALDELIPESEAVHISDFVENVKMKSKTPEAKNEKK